MKPFYDDDVCLRLRLFVLCDRTVDIGMDTRMEMVKATHLHFNIINSKIYSGFDFVIESPVVNNQRWLPDVELMEVNTGKMEYKDLPSYAHKME